jgi:hypothetical protein
MEFMNQKGIRLTQQRLAEMHGWICHYCQIPIHQASGVRPMLEKEFPYLICEFCYRAKGKESVATYVRWLKWVKSQE